MKLSSRQDAYAKAFAAGMVKRVREDQALRADAPGLHVLRAYAIVQCGRYHRAPEATRAALYDRILRHRTDGAP